MLRSIEFSLCLLLVSGVANANIFTPDEAEEFVLHCYNQLVDSLVSVGGEKIVNSVEYFQNTTQLAVQYLIKFLPPDNLTIVENRFLKIIFLIKPIRNVYDGLFPMLRFQSVNIETYNNVKLDDNINKMLFYVKGESEEMKGESIFHLLAYRNSKLCRINDKVDDLLGRFHSNIMCVEMLAAISEMRAIDFRFTSTDLKKLLKDNEIKKLRYRIAELNDLVLSAYACA